MKKVTRLLFSCGLLLLVFTAFGQMPYKSFVNSGVFFKNIDKEYKSAPMFF